MSKEKETEVKSDMVIGWWMRRTFPKKRLNGWIGIIACRMKVGEPSADGRGSAPPELAEQQARAGSEAAPATPPL